MENSDVNQIGESDQAETTKPPEKVKIETIKNTIYQLPYLAILFVTLSDILAISAILTSKFFTLSMFFALCIPLVVLTGTLTLAFYMLKLFYLSYIYSVENGINKFVSDIRSMKIDKRIKPIITISIIYLVLLFVFLLFFDNFSKEPLNIIRLITIYSPFFFIPLVDIYLLVIYKKEIKDWASSLHKIRLKADPKKIISYFFSK